MNVISYEKAYCFYPRATLHDKLSLICKEEDNPTLPGVMDKYEHRGYEFITGKQRSNSELSKKRKFYLSLRKFATSAILFVGPFLWTPPYSDARQVSRDPEGTVELSHCRTIQSVQSAGASITRTVSI